MSRSKEVKILIILILLLFLINYPFIDSYLVKTFSYEEVARVERVIDGDTIKANNESIRLLGINTPELGEAYYSEAGDFLEDLILNESIELRVSREREDRYGRLLRYVFYKGENINLKLVQEGYANFYFPSGKDNYYDKFYYAWESCLENGENLCEKTDHECALCLDITLAQEEEIITIENRCAKNCNLTGWNIKDEGRKKFVFPSFNLEKKVEVIVGEGQDSEERLFWRGEKYVFTKTGDSVFIRDRLDKLVFWDNY